MKQFVFFFSLTCSILYFVNRNAVGQIMEFPGVFYKKTEFDVVHRGSYNMTDCASELINCWEVIRPDILCDYNRQHFESICGALRSHCSEKFGPVDVKYDQWYRLSTFTCESYRIYTRRYMSIPRNDSRAIAILRALNYTDAMGGH